MAIKLFFFDLEGTIFQNPAVPVGEDENEIFTNLWSLLFHYLGDEAVAAEQQNYQKWKNQEYDSYLDWAADSARLLKEYGLTRALYREAVDQIPYNPGIEELFEQLHSQQIRTAIISGGFYNHAKKAQIDLGIRHSYAAVDLFWDKSGELAGWNILPSDYEGKVDFVRLLEREYKLNLDQCAFMGDEHNDVFIAREVGVSFAYNAHPDLKEAANHSITHPSEILDLI